MQKAQEEQMKKFQEQQQQQGRCAPGWWFCASSGRQAVLARVLPRPPPADAKPAEPGSDAFWKCVVLLNAGVRGTCKWGCGLWAQRW